MAEGGAGGGADDELGGIRRGPQLHVRFRIPAGRTAGIDHRRCQRRGQQGPAGPPHRHGRLLPAGADRAGAGNALFRRQVAGRSSGFQQHQQILLYLGDGVHAPGLRL